MHEHVFVMHTAETVEHVLTLRAAGLGARRISAQTGVPVRTATDWLAGRLPHVPRTRPDVGGCPSCGHAGLEISNQGAYAYLLGLYLGDGCLSAHPRGVYKLRITLDAAYPGIVDDAEQAIRKATGSRVGRWRKPKNSIEVYSYSKHWPCLFPQHGPGTKHRRAIELMPWQLEIVKLHPQSLLRGLVHSDGCRSDNTGRDGWRAPRYSFTNLSEDILAIFEWVCELLGLRWTAAPDKVYVSRKADVARMDEFIGPKA